MTNTDNKEIDILAKKWSWWIPFIMCQLLLVTFMVCIVLLPIFLVSDNYWLAGPYIITALSPIAYISLYFFLRYKLCLYGTELRSLKAWIVSGIMGGVIWFVFWLFYIINQSLGDVLVSYLLCIGNGIYFVGIPVITAGFLLIEHIIEKFKQRRVQQW